jgi:DNA polymerase-4
VPPDFTKYRDVSQQVMAIFEQVTPLVEPLSIDEAFLDVRGVRRLWGSPGVIGAMIRNRVQAEVGITCSVGGRRHQARRQDGVDPGEARRSARRRGGRDARLPRHQARAGDVGCGPKTAETLESRASA